MATKKKETISSKLTQSNNYIAKMTLSRYKNAVDTAESILYPNRTELLQIYNDIIKDPHLSSVIKHRKTRIKGLQYNLYKDSGRTDKQSLKIFTDKSFNKFLEYTLDAMFNGNSLVEIVLDSEGIIDYNLIPRENVIPEKQMIKFNAWSTNGDIDYSLPQYKSTLVDINNNDNNRNLGELLDVAKLILFKNEMLLNWSQYIELFGQPWRVATTDTNDPEVTNAILQSLKEVGRSGYFIKDSQTKLEMIANSSNSQSLYESFAKYIDEQVSKKILGASMITDDGASQSQAQVHLTSSYIFTKSDIKWIEGVINYQLIPTLVELGYIPKAVTFAFTEPEILTIDEKIKIDTFLLSNFNIPELSYFSDRYGVTLEPKNKPVENDNTSQGI